MGLGEVKKFACAGGRLAIVHDEATAAAEGLASFPTGARGGKITLVTARATQEVLVIVVRDVGEEAHERRLHRTGPRVLGREG